MKSIIFYVCNLDSILGNITVATNELTIPEPLWVDAEASALTDQELLLYRSNLLGSNLAVTNFGGGNTSSELKMPDPLTGEEVEVLWVKGSGGDLGSMALNGFATLYVEKLLQLENKYRGLEFEDEMVGYLPHCTFNLNPRAASIDTPLHGFLPFAHVDHVHPDALIAIAAADMGEAFSEDIYEGKVGWLPWQRPGFDLGLRMRDYVNANPHLNGIILEGHGLFSWGDTSTDCYANTIDIIAKAARALNDRLIHKPGFAGAVVDAEPHGRRAEIAAQIMPQIRAHIGQSAQTIGHFIDTPEVLDFVNSKSFEELAEKGTSCPDHFLRTKIKPIILSVEKLDQGEGVYLENTLEQYRRDYEAYYERCHHADSPDMRDSNPVVYLIPQVGMITFAKDKSTARIAGEFYVNAINVMRGATLIGNYVNIDEQEAFNIEYWLLEEAKLKRMPPKKSLEGQVAYITGGAGGIGKAVAIRLLQDGACVVLTDIDNDALDAASEELASTFNPDCVRVFAADVTDEEQVAASFAYTVREYGGLDILVANAGIASSAPIEETTLGLWQKNFQVLAQGYFLVAREAFSLMKSLGGSIVFVASKNALAASPNASAYCSAKASELHLARCLALEGAPYGIRVNSVNPDAVIRGSKIWSGDWRKERAGAYGIEQSELEQHYRERSLLKRSVYPEDIAEAISFFVSEHSAKSTGNILNVDAGNAAAFVR